MEIAKSAPLKCEIKIPGDKSISHRAAMLASLREEPTIIRNYLRAADCLSTLECLRKMGAKIEDDGETLTIRGGLHDATAILDCGNSGTTLRLLMGLVAGQGLSATFTGDDSLKRRPLDRIIKPLRLMGAQIEGERLPVTIHHSTLHKIRYEMPIASAQVKSALMLAGLKCGVEIIERIPTRDHTERLLEMIGFGSKGFGSKGFGSKGFGNRDLGIKGKPLTPDTRHLTPVTLHIPGDVSSAAYWIVAATLIPKSEIILREVGINPTRTGLIDVLRKMGASITISNERLVSNEPVGDIAVKAAALSGAEIGGEIIPRMIDEIPIVSVAAAFADGQTIIRDVGELKVKESNRLTAIMELNKLKPGSVRAEGDTLIISGTAETRNLPCKTFGDHRIAMSLAIAGMIGEGVTLDDTDCVNISYPHFFS